MATSAEHRVLVVGFGSIGRRHADLLAATKANVGVVSGQATDGPYPVWRTLDEALNAHRPTAVVIANVTSNHLATLGALAKAGFTGRVLVEKPLFARTDPLPSHRFERLAVGYNLRFHPLIAKVRETIAGKTILSVIVRCGQYLPAWRPGTDYRQSYSASIESGGGVLRDLSHELDYLLHLFGPWARLSAAGGKRGPLEIASDDMWSVICELSSGALASINLDYWNRPVQRTIAIETTNGSVIADLVAGTFSINGEMQTIETQRDDSYRLLHAAFLGDDDRLICTAQDGLRVMQMIEAIETAARDRKWVTP